MGLANKLNAPPASGPASAPSAPSAPPLPGAGPYGAPPQGAYNNTAPGVDPGQSNAPGGFPGQPAPGQYGQAGQQQSSQFGAPLGQQIGQTGPRVGQSGPPFGQQPGQFGGQTGQYGTQPGQFGSQPGQFGSRPAQSGLLPGQSAPPFGQHPGQYGQQPGQYGQQPGQFGQQQAQFAQPGQQPGGSFGAPGQGPMPGGPGGASGFDQHTIKQKLQQLVMENRLQAFYPPQRLDQLVQFVLGRDVAGLGVRWKLPREVTLDLVGLALYDIVIYVDDSGSMAFEEGGERIDDMKAVLGRTADAATLFDTDGIVVRFMNGTVEGNGIRSEAEAAALIHQVKFSGTTPLGSNLDRKVLQPMVLSQARSGSMQKPVLVICITDGEPTGEPKDTVRQVVVNAKSQLQSSPYGPGAVAFQFAQVGKDGAATRFLSALDTDPMIGSMIDCTSYYEQEQEEYARKGINLDPSLYLVKLMVGGIDRSYDEGDEG